MKTRIIYMVLFIDKEDPESTFVRIFKNQNLANSAHYPLYHKITLDPVEVDQDGKRVS